MIKRLLSLLLTSVMVSCVAETEVPKDVLNEDKMKEVLWDVMRAEYLASQKARLDSTVDLAAESKVLNTKVFAIHGIDSATYAKSYDWYVRHPEIMGALFDSLLMQKQRGEFINDEGRRLHRKPEKKLLEK